MKKLKIKRLDKKTQESSKGGARRRVRRVGIAVQRARSIG